MNRTVRNRSFRALRPAGQLEMPPSPASPMVSQPQQFPQGTIGAPAYSYGSQPNLPSAPNTPAYAVAPQPLQPSPYGTPATPYTPSQTPAPYGTGVGTTVGTVAPQTPVSPGATMPTAPSAVISFGGVTPIGPITGIPSVPGATPGAVAPGAPAATPGAGAPGATGPGLGTAYVVPGVAQPVAGSALGTAYFVPEMPAALGGAAEDGVPWWLIALFLGGAAGIVYASRGEAAPRNNPGKSHDPRPGSKRIAITFETITPESAEQGDAADRGWIDEDGVEMTPDEYDREEGITAVDKAVKFLKYEGASEPSSSHFYEGVWYTAYETDTDYSTGETTNKSYHLKGFTKAEQEAIFNKMKSRR